MGDFESIITGSVFWNPRNELENLLKFYTLRESFRVLKKKFIADDWRTLSLAHLQIEKMGKIDQDILNRANKAIIAELDNVSYWAFPEKRQRELLEFRKLINSPPDELLAYSVMKKITD